MVVALFGVNSDPKTRRYWGGDGSGPHSQVPHPAQLLNKQCGLTKDLSSWKKPSALWTEVQISRVQEDRANLYARPAPLSITVRGDGVQTGPCVLAISGSSWEGLLCPCLSSFS